MKSLNQQLDCPNVPTINDGELTRESWKIFQIMAEFVEGFEKLASITPSVSIFWDGRIQSFRDTLIREGNIGREDLNVFQLVDKSGEVVEAIFKSYDDRCLELSAA